MIQRQNTMEAEQLTTADLANVANGRDSQQAGHPEDGHPEDHGTERPDQYSGPLLAPDSLNDMRTRWETIQTGFVDDPRVSVQQADELVASAIKKLAESFAEERAKLEQQWSK